MKTLSFEDIVARLARVRLPEVDLVVGISDGGIVPASLVAYRLKKPLTFLAINFRDPANTPRYQRPKLLKSFRLPRGVRHVLLVDDVAVTGATLARAKDVFKDCAVTTLAFKGKADKVLFPEIKECVFWPWKSLGGETRDKRQETRDKRQGARGERR